MIIFNGSLVLLRINLGAEAQLELSLAKIPVYKEENKKNMKITNKIVNKQSQERLWVNKLLQSNINTLKS